MGVEGGLDGTALFCLFGAAQAAALALGVASMGRGDPRPSGSLSLLLLTLAAAVAAVTIQHGKLFANQLPWILAEVSAPFVFGPTLFFYAQVVVGRHVSAKVLLHGIPALAWGGYLVAFTCERQWLGSDFLPRWLPPDWLLVAYMLAYTTWAAHLAFQKGAGTRALRSHLPILRLTVLVLVAIHGAQGLRFLFPDVRGMADIVPLTGAGSAYFISILAFRRSLQFVRPDPARRRSDPSQALTPEREQRISERLMELLASEKPHLNESVSLAEVANRLGISRSHLSQAVNARLGTNFSALLNRYRVEEACRLLGDPAFDHLTIDAIGYQAGFQSRSTFYSAFKQIRGETPGQTRRRRS